MINKRLEADIVENQDCGNELNSSCSADEELAGYNCPRCGYPIVIEAGLEVCYKCGWSKDEEPEGYYDE